MANENSWASYSSNVLRDPWFTILNASTATAAIVPFGIVAGATIDTGIANGSVVPMGGADGLIIMVGGAGADGATASLGVSRLTKVPDAAFYVGEPLYLGSVVLSTALTGSAVLGFAADDRWADGLAQGSGYPASGDMTSSGIVVNSNTANIPGWVILYAYGATHLRFQVDLGTATALTVIGRRVAGLSQRD